jgi:hypothetical protein
MQFRDIGQFVFAELFDHEADLLIDRLQIG